MEIRVITPRIAARYGNIVSFSLPILEGEVNPLDLMLIEGVRLFYPKLYETIRKYPDLFLGKNLSTHYGNTSEQEKKRTRDLIEAGLSDYSPDEKHAAISLIQSLFPRLKGVYGNVFYGPEWEATWAKEKKIASQDYISRYFSYSITETDVSDTALNSFLASLEEKSEKEATENFVALIKGNNIEKIISKLRQRADQISYKSSKKLSILIAVLGKIFPNPDQLFSFRGPFSQAAMLVGDLILNIPDKEERLEFANHLIRIAEPITFSVEITRWFRNEKEDKYPRGFSPEENLALRKFLVERIKETCRSINIFNEFPEDAGRLLSIWAAWGQGQDQAEYLTALLNENPPQVSTLLSNVVPTAWTMDTGISSKGDLDRGNYDSISKIISPVVIVEALEKVFGDRVNTEEYPYDYSEKDTNLRLAQQFTWIHRRAGEEAKHEKQNGGKE